MPWPIEELLIEQPGIRVGLRPVSDVDTVRNPMARPLYRRHNGLVNMTGSRNGCYSDVRLIVLLNEGIGRLKYTITSARNAHQRMQTRSHWGLYTHILNCALNEKITPVKHTSDIPVVRCINPDENHGVWKKGEYNSHSFSWMSARCVLLKGDTYVTRI